MAEYSRRTKKLSFRVNIKENGRLSAIIYQLPSANNFEALVMMNAYRLL